MPYLCTGWIFDLSGDYALAFNCFGGFMIFIAGIVFIHSVWDCTNRCRYLDMS